MVVVRKKIDKKNKVQTEQDKDFLSLQSFYETKYPKEVQILQLFLKTMISRIVASLTNCGHISLREQKC